MKIRIMNVWVFLFIANFLNISHAENSPKENSSALYDGLSKEQVKRYKDYDEKIYTPAIAFMHAKRWREAENLLNAFISDKKTPFNYKFATSNLLMLAYKLQGKDQELIVLGEELLTLDELGSLGAFDVKMTILDRTWVRDLKMYMELRDAYLRQHENIKAKRVEIRVKNVLTRSRDEAHLQTWKDFISGKDETEKEKKEKADLEKKFYEGLNQERNKKTWKEKNGVGVSQ